MQKAFSLPEVMTAVFVILIGVVGIYALVPEIIGTVFANQDRFIAVQLAREGIEIVRNIRDANWLENDLGSPNAWDESLDTTCSLGCEIDYFTSLEQDPILDVFGIDGNYLNIDTQEFYSYQVSDNPTKFKRKITITSLVANRLDIVVEVFWSENSLILRENLYNWR